MAAKWGREEEFKRLFQAQMKRMTRDGLDTLVYIAIKDMNECYKAVPALALHLMKRQSKEGPARLHVIRIVDAIIGKSRLKNKLTDKFVPRIEAAKMSQALFAQMKECNMDQKSKAAKILQMWRKHNILSPPSQAATEDALGTEMLATSGDSAALKPGGVSSNIVSGSDNDTVADANTKAAAAAAAAAAAEPPGNVTVTSPLATFAKRAAQTQIGGSSDSGQKGGMLGAAQLVPPTATTSATATGTAFTSVDISAFQGEINTAAVQRTPVARTSSEEMRRSLAQLSQASADTPLPDSQAAGALLVPQPEKDGAPPLPPDDVAPFDSGVDAVVLPSGATLTNPQIAVVKPPRRSKFDRPASGRQAAAPNPPSQLATVQPPLPPNSAPAAYAAANDAAAATASPSAALDAGASARIQMSLAAQRDRLSLSEMSKHTPAESAVPPVATGGTPPASNRTVPSSFPQGLPPPSAAAAGLPSASGPESSAHTPHNAPPGLQFLSPSRSVPGLPGPVASSQPPHSSSAAMIGNAWGFETQGFPRRPPGNAPALMMSLPALSLPPGTGSQPHGLPSASEPPPPGCIATPSHNIPQFQVPPPASQAATPPISAAAAPSNAPASIEVLPPPSFGEVWSPAPSAVKSATPTHAGQSGAPPPPPAPPSTLPSSSNTLPPVGQQHAHAQHAQQGAGGYNPMSASPAQHASQPAAPHMQAQQGQWPPVPGMTAAAPAQPFGHPHQHMTPGLRMPMHPHFPPRGPPASFPRGPAGHPAAGHLPPPMQSNAPRAPFLGGNMHGHTPGAHVPYNPFAASSSPPIGAPRPLQPPRQVPVPPSAAASGQHPRGPMHRPVSLSPPSQPASAVAAAAAGSGVPGPPPPPPGPPRAPSSEQPTTPSGQQEELPGPPVASPSPVKPSGNNSTQALPPPPPGPPAISPSGKASGQENAVNGCGANGSVGCKAEGIGAKRSSGGSPSVGDGVVPRKKRRSRWDDSAE